MKALTTLLLIFGPVFISYGQPSESTVQIAGHADFVQTGDTIKLKIFKYGLINMEASFQTDLVAIAQKHDFIFKIPDFYDTQYISIFFKSNQNDLYSYFIRPGDKIKLTFKNGQLNISGERSQGFQLQYQLRQIRTNYYVQHSQPEFSPTNLPEIFNNYDEVGKEQNAFLNGHKRNLCSSTVCSLQTLIVGVVSWSKYNDLNSWIAAGSDGYRDSLLISFHEYQVTHKEFSITPSVVDWNCDPYINSRLEEYKFQFYRSIKQICNATDCLNYIVGNYKDKSREQLAVALLTNSKRFPLTLRPLIEDLLPEVRNKNYYKFLSELLRSRVGGAKAYDFALENTDGKVIHLSDYKGQVVLIDFWFTGCENCRELTPFMSQIEEKFREKPVKFVSICIDKNKSKWLNSINSKSYVSPDMTNLYTGGNGLKCDVINAYHALAFPTLILITPKGFLVDVPVDPRIDKGDKLTELINDCLL